MSLVPQSSTLVIRGNFNPYVFSPDWLLAQKFTNTIEGISLSFGGVEDGIRFSVDGIDWIVNQSTIRLSSKGIDPSIAEVGIKILQLLPHTPILAVTFLFSYRSSEKIEEVTPLIQGRKISDVFSEKPYPLGTDLVRWGMVSRSDTTRIEVTFTIGSNGVTANLNFHTNVGESTPVGSAEEAIACCNKFSQFSAKAEELINKTLNPPC